MRVLNSMPKYKAIVISRYWAIDMNWTGTKYVKNRKTLNIQFCCPLCSHEAIFITEANDSGPWRVDCTGCDKWLRLDNEE